MEEKNMPDDRHPSENNMKIISIIIVVIFLAVGIYFLLKKSPAVAPDQGTVNQSQSRSVAEAEERVFNLSAKPFEYSLKEIRVKKGDVVRINLTVMQGSHNLVIDEFKAQTKQLKSGESDSIIFMADRVGTFEFYCSVANHRQLGMVGKLIIEE